MLRAAALVLCLAACSKSEPAELPPDVVEKLTEQKPLELPPPDKNTLQTAPVIIVTKTEVTYQGQLMASVDDVVKDPHALAPLDRVLRSAADSIKLELATGGYPPELVQACEDQRKGIRPTLGRMCPDGLAILQADQATDMRVINAVVLTAKKAGFDNLLFAVKNK